MSAYLRRGLRGGALGRTGPRDGSTMPGHVQHGVFHVSFHQVPEANLLINLHSPSITLSYCLSVKLYHTGNEVQRAGKDCQV